MDQRNETFVPHVLAITDRHDGRFPEQRSASTTTCSRSRRRKSFDLGRYAAGRSQAVRFDRPGIVRVFCDIHSHMSAFILVFAIRSSRVTDDDGRYRIETCRRAPTPSWRGTKATPLESAAVAVPDGGGERARFRARPR